MEPPRLEVKSRIEGYGMQAVTKLALWRMVAMLFLTQILSVIFLIYWLIRHPGDIQDAVAVITTTLAGFAIYLALLSKHGSQMA